MFSVLFRTILTVFSTKTFHFGGNTDVSFQIVQQEEYAADSCSGIVTKRC